VPHTTSESLRKTLHIGFGLLALSLHWLTWLEAAVVALLAVFANWMLLHRIAGKEVSRHERGFDSGIILYPLSVLAAILIFHDGLELAGAVWAILAYGDGFATLAGQRLGGPRLPWNRDKSLSGFVAFLVAGYAGAFLTVHFLGWHQKTLLVIPLILAIAVVAAGITESLRTHIDDNLTVPLAAGLALWAGISVSNRLALDFDRTMLIWLAVNTVLAVAGYVARSVDLSGAAGGWLLGAILIVFGGWPAYVALLAFFVISTAATKLGYQRKAKEGLAQEKGGRRGFSHAFANAGVAAILTILSSCNGDRIVFLLAAVASLATAAADTCGSEIGQLLGKRTYLPLTFRPVPRGTEGAVSLEGTIASLAAALLVTVISLMAMRETQLLLIVLVTLCGFAGAYLESIAGSWNRKRADPIPNGVMNFFNTMVGAGLFLVIVNVVNSLGR
jgi:uncharacterized protein (TIGR00297 family)